MTRSSIRLSQMRDHRAAEVAVGEPDRRRFTVSRTIYPDTEIVALNGVTVAYGADHDYTVVDDAVIFTQPTEPGDQVLVSYVPMTPGEAPAFGDQDPAEIEGATVAGSSPYVARADHSHALARGSVTLDKLGSGSAGKVIGFDAQGHAAELSFPAPPDAYTKAQSDGRYHQPGAALDFNRATVSRPTLDRWTEKIIDLTGISLTAGANALCAAQTSAAAGNLVLNGADASGGQVAWANKAHPISLTSVGNLSAVSFTIVGINQDGVADSETRTGPNNATVQTAKAFRSISSVTVNAAITTAVQVGRAAGKVALDLDAANCFYLPIPSAPTTIRIVGGAPGGGVASSLMLVTKQASPAQTLAWETAASGGLIWDASATAPTAAGAAKHEKYVFQRFDPDPSVITAARVFKEI